MSQRQILLTDIDPMALVDELATGAVTDGRGLTLGDIAGHRRARYETLWHVLHLLGAMARQGMLRAADSITPIGAEVQDKNAMDVFQAAHVLPCDFRINGSDGLYNLFVSPIIRGSVKAHLFGRTTIVHKLVNYADSRCEANGWRRALHDAIDRLIAGDAADTVFRRDLVPAYAAALVRARDKLEAAFTVAQRQAANTPALLQPNGLTAVPRVQDFRVSAKARDPKVAGINKAVVLQAFDEYRLGPAGLSPAELARSARQAQDWAELERQWRAKHA